ncbi:class I SAM-dependent methyltransferase [Nocardioides sp. KR10-350]|uniref:class I SAM-dependent methyltransferase n=1 Tax=Nocardioides cheoyonin TaxID=3156615 RepID=UPI0032B34BE7
MTAQPDPDRGATPDPARSFGRVADAYDRGRPSYPRDAVEWLVGTEPVSVLELGAGTGKLTELLVSLGHDVFATDPDDAMLDVLSAKLPDVRATVGTAEQIPAGDGLYDVVVAAQAFHWFDAEKALPEIVRVLRPGGRLALLWNERDERIPWVRKLTALIGNQSHGEDPTRAIDDSALFSAVDTAEYRHWQTIDRDSVQDLVLSRSTIAALPEERREAKRREVLAFYDDYGRGMDGMQLPYTCRCFRAAVLPHAQTKRTVEIAEPGADPLAPLYRPTDTADRLPRVMTSEDDPGSEMILIDFR